MNTLFHRAPWRFASLGLLLAACQLDPSSVRGELGKGTFQYTCDSSTRVCKAGVADKFPERIALDTRFDLGFVPNSGTVSTGSLRPASEQLLEIRDSSWRAIGSGTVGILDVLPDGSLYDYTFVTIEPATSVRFFTERSAQARGVGTEQSDLNAWQDLGALLELQTGRSLKLIAEAQAADGSVLAGESLLDFECTTAGVAELVRPAQRPARFAIAGIGTGTTACTLHALGIAHTFEVRVTEAPEQPDGGAEESHDAGVDAAVDPDGGAR